MILTIKKKWKKLCPKNINPMRQDNEDKYYAVMIMNKSHQHSLEIMNAFHQYFHDLRKKLE